MTDQQTTTNGVNLPAPVISMREQLPALLEKNIPWMEAKKIVGEDLLDSISPPTTDDEREDVVAKLAAASQLYTAMSARRTEMTKITDAFKDVVMEYERPFDTKSGAKSKYQEKRKYVEAYDQQKLDKRRLEEQEAAKRKELENLKVDLKAKMLSNLSQMLIAVVKRVDAGSKEYFDAATLEDFDKKAELYKTNKPKLKKEEYEACFIRPVDPIGSKNIELLSQVDYARFVVSVQQEETFDKWNSALVEALAPILNEWRARIPDLKKQKQELAEAANKSKEEADALAAKQKADADAQFKQRQHQLDAVQKENENKIQEQAHVDKIGNDLQAQASLWDATQVGATKLGLKFLDPKQVPKGLMEMIYHVMASDKFEGIQKRDKNKKLMVDDRGNPIYIDGIQIWIDLFLRHCKGNITGAEIYQIAKTTIRK